jgi:hypothetical protein
MGEVFGREVAKFTDFPHQQHPSVRNGGRRRYATYRIPASVAERVHRRMSKFR